MDTYRLAAAKLLIYTYGEKLKYTQLGSMNKVVLQIPDSEIITKQLINAKKDFTSKPNESEIDAIEDAIDYINVLLTKALGKNAKIEKDTESYLPIRDADGNIVGHDTVDTLLVEQDTKSGKVWQEVWHEPQLASPGGFAVVYLAVEKVTA